MSQHPIRFITATSLFDGHDASINIMRRILQSKGVEVIHLGHNRGVEEIVQAAIQEDVHGIAISSYQGGHNEFFQYMVDLLEEKGAKHIKTFGGGGGVIIPQEIKELMKYGVTKIYSPEDGRQLGLEGMIDDMLSHCQFSSLSEGFRPEPSKVKELDARYLGQCITWIEQQVEHTERLSTLFDEFPKDNKVPVVGITGTGGSGKSCLTDNLVRNFLAEFETAKVAIVSVDPTKRRTSGALLGDRMRMNALDSDRVYMRSLATRTEHRAISSSLEATIQLYKNSDFDLILVETAGIGQSDSELTDMVDVSIYVMTPEFGAATQLEKIDMLDYADLIAVNKLDKPGAEDALNAVRKQYQRNHKIFGDGHTPVNPESFPIFGTMADTFFDPGTLQFYNHLLNSLVEKGLFSHERRPLENFEGSSVQEIIPSEASNYLASIVSTIRRYKKDLKKHSALARECCQLYGALQQFHSELPRPFESWDLSAFSGIALEIAKKYQEKLQSLPTSMHEELEGFWLQRQNYKADYSSYEVRGKTIQVENHSTSLSGLKIPKIGTPKYEDWGDILSWLGSENFPGNFPYTAGVFPFKRQGEDPTRMFAGEGIAERTNRRFHYLSNGQPAARLSTAFDSVTLYGANPAARPDIYGKVGNAGVSVSTVDDAKRLYSGFNLCSPSTSVSLTINGPAPMILAFFLNAAIDQQVELYLQENGKLGEAQEQIKALYEEQGLTPPVYRNTLPENHNQLGLPTLGISGDQLVSAEVYQEIKSKALASVRGTVQADILKEDQAQNTCIFSTSFALRLMGDIQEYFTQNRVRNFYSVSISGYHIAEAGANPITQVAFTLANGFTFIEYYLARGLEIDDFAGNLSFFFSNGMDPEYSVIGRVARRIFAIALRDRYQANPRSQKLKYHIQTSGRSLHAQEIEFNDIRTTLQALYAIYDNCNSLHTNAYDEAITTPTEESVRRALAIQLIINRELGLSKSENFLQGSFVTEELTDLVEEAILSEFLRISERGGVLGAMETMYQRNKIQEESMYYEEKKHSGSLPIVGVNTFLSPNSQEEAADSIELARSDEEEKVAQLQSLEQFHQFHQQESSEALEKLRTGYKQNENLFDILMEAVKVCSLGQISTELYSLGGKYRRNT